MGGRLSFSPFLFLSPVLDSARAEETGGRKEESWRRGKRDKMLARLQDKEPEPYELVVVHKRYQPHLHIPGTWVSKRKGGEPEVGPRQKERRER